MAIIALEPPMPRMLGVSSEFKRWTREVELAEDTTLEAFLLRLSDEVSPLFKEAIERRPKTYFEQIRIAVDDGFAPSDDYTVAVHNDSTVTILAPYIDG